MASGRVHNILILDNELGMGGLEKKLYDLVSRIDRSRFRVSVCCLKRGGYFKDKFVELGVPFHEGLLRHKYDATAFIGLSRIIRAERIDLVYTFIHANTLILSSLARATGLVRALVVSVHATGTATGGLMLKGFQRRLLNRAERVIAVANAHKRYLVEREGLNGSNITVIHNGVETERYRPGAADPGLRRQLGVGEGESVVTTVASLKPLKCIDNLLAAAAKLRTRRENVRFLIVGDGPDREALEETARELGVADRVSFTGIRDDVDEIMRLSDVFVLPSRTEAFPNAVLEAMASGLPVVSTDVGSVRELVVDGETGVVVAPDDVDALADAINRTLEDPTLAREWGRAGRRIVESGFSIESMCEKRQDVFAEILEGRA